MKEDATSGSASPVDAVDYIASSTFAGGTQIGSTGWYAVYNGTGTSVNVSNLDGTKNYRVHVVEYNGPYSGTSKYFTTSGSGNPATKNANIGNTIYVNASSGNDSTGDGSSGNPYKTFHKAYQSAVDGDTIHLSGTINWADADETGDATTSGYTINKVGLTIRGESATSTILQAHSSVGSAGRRVFTVVASTTIEKLNIRHGSGPAGGCILVNTGATLTIREAEINNCRTSGTADGGGIWAGVGASLHVSNSTIYDNKASGVYAGGIYFNSSGGTLTLMNTTMTGNYSDYSSNAREGGAIYLYTGTAIITNSTIVRNGTNLGGGNGTTYGGGIRIRNDAGALLYIQNSIVAENTAGQSGNENISRAGGTATSGGYNIIGRSSNFTPASVGDWYDASNSGTFTLTGLGTTGELGVASTLSLHDSSLVAQTIALLAGSIAINNATTTSHQGVAVPLFDQRNVSRVGDPDIGAFEFDGTPASPTLPATNISIGAISQASTTISWTNGNGDARVVFMKVSGTGTSTPVDGTSYSGNSVFGSGTQIGSTGWYAVYNGTGTSVNVSNLDYASSYRVHVVEYSGVNTELRYRTDADTGNPTTKDVYAGSTVHVHSSSGNDSTGDGSSGNPYKTFHKAFTVAADGDTINLTGVFDWSDDVGGETGDVSTNGYVINKNGLIVQGGGVGTTTIQAHHTDNAGVRRVFTLSSNISLTIRDLSVRYGRTASGGCINLSSSATLTLRGVHMSECRSTSNGGGGIFSSASGATVTIENSSLFTNVATNNHGGAVLLSGANSVLTVTNTTFTGNQTTGGSTHGGAAFYIAGSGSTAHVTNSTITKNYTYYGAVYTSSAAVTFKNTIVSGNIGFGTANRANFFRSGGSFTSDGYNIFGIYDTTYFNSITTGDWADGSGGGTYTLSGLGTTGSLTLLATTTATNGMMVSPFSAGSVGIDHGTTTAHGSVSIPSADQVGATRTAIPDIGALEYDAGLDEDVTNPSVSLTAPDDNATVSGTEVTISANASDDRAVVDVKFYIQGVLIGTDESAPYSIVWDSTATTSESKTLIAVARDAAGNVATSTARTITVSNDEVAPTVSLTAPDNNATVSGASVTLSASASDNVGVADVRFYINGVLIGTDSTAPYSVSWNSMATSSEEKTLIAVARDAAGNVATSTARTITVDNPLTSYLIRHWKLDEASPSAPVVDSSTAEDTATATGTTVTPLSAPILFDNAYARSFNGTSDRITTGYSPHITPGDSFTWSLWFRTGTNQIGKGIFSARDNNKDGDPLAEIYLVSGKIQGLFRGANGTRKDLEYTVNYADAHWHHVAITIDADGNGKLFYDGVEQASFTGLDMNIDLRDVYVPIGASNYEGTIQRWYTGALDDVRVYSRALSGAEVSALAERKPPTPSSVTQASRAQNTATINWTTPTFGTTKIFYGVVNPLAKTTSEVNTDGSATTTHAVSLSDLPKCTTYTYYAVTRSLAGDIATSSPQTFRTSCTGDANVSTTTATSITVLSGGSLTHGKLSLSIPSGFTATSSTVTFQASTLDASTVTGAIGTAQNKTRFGDIYYLNSLYNETETLNQFTEPITVTLSYAGESNVDESSLFIARYEDGQWESLYTTIDTVAKTVSATTSVATGASAFSDWGVFGDTVAVVSSVSASDTVVGSIIVGCGDASAQNYSPLVYHDPLTCRYAPSQTNLSSSPVPSSHVYIRNLEVGAIGDDVRALQTFLITQGFSIPAGATGYFGGQTQSALASYQAMRGITPAVGYFGPVTRARINSELAGSSTVTTSQAQVPVPTNQQPVNPLSQTGSVRDLEFGMEGDDVRQLQTLLMNQGHTIPAGATGYFGGQTRSALSAYQRAQGIVPSSGYFGPLTRTQMKTAGIAGVWW